MGSDYCVNSLYVVCELGFYEGTDDSHLRKGNSCLLLSSPIYLASLQMYPKQQPSLPH